MLRNFVKPNERETKERTYRFRRGTTAWKKEEIKNLIVNEEVTPLDVQTGGGARPGGEAMDTS
jgi:20S proteasome subunit beta 2